VEVLPGRVTHRAWTGWEDEHSNFTPGFLVPANHVVVAAAAAALYHATAREPRVRQWKFGTDGGHSCGTHGIPTIGFAPGDEALAHTNRERLALAPAREAFDAYPALIRAVQGALAPEFGITPQGLSFAGPAHEATAPFLEIVMAPTL
jgi:succinyl-diaminopimelate desuccinylase